jgi:glycosyltransferase involved in cell wall biosynthesis
MPDEELADAPDNDGTDRYDDRTIVLYLGYLNRRKGVDYLLSAWDSLKQDAESPALTDALLVIAGSGPHGDTLRQNAQHVKDVEFIGHVKGKQKSHYYNMADVFVLPTLHDPWGLVVNEAISFDLPVVVTEAAGSEEFVRQEEVGVVVDPANSADLEHALRRLITDEQYRKSFARSAANNESATDPSVGIQPFIELLKERDSEQELRL